MKTQMQFSIPEPCHESEDKMISCGEGKFCFSCRKYVYDFTKWSKEELQDFFKKKSTESICAKVRPEVLSSPATEPVSKRFLRMFAYALYLAFGMILFSCNPKQIKVPNKGEVIEQPCATSGAMRAEPIAMSDTITKPVAIVEGNIFPIGDVVAYNDPIIRDTVDIPETNIMAKEVHYGISGGMFYEAVSIDEPDTFPTIDTTAARFDNEAAYQKQSLKLYPNPSNGSFHINYKSRENGDVLIKVFDLTGKEVAVVEDSKQKQSGVYDTDASLNFLPSGTYILFASLNKEVFTQEFVVQK